MIPTRGTRAGSVRLLHLGSAPLPSCLTHASERVMVQRYENDPSVFLPSIDAWSYRAAIGRK